MWTPRMLHVLKGGVTARCTPISRGIGRLEIKKIESLAGDAELAGDGSEQEFLLNYRSLPREQRKALILQALSQIPDISSPCRSRLRAVPVS